MVISFGNHDTFTVQLSANLTMGEAQGQRRFNVWQPLPDARSDTFLGMRLEGFEKGGAHRMRTVIAQKAIFFRQGRQNVARSVSR